MGGLASELRAGMWALSSRDDSLPHGAGCSRRVWERAVWARVWGRVRAEVGVGAGPGQEGQGGPTKCRDTDLELGRPGDDPAGTALARRRWGAAGGCGAPSRADGLFPMESELEMMAGGPGPAGPVVWALT